MATTVDWPSSLTMSLQWENYRKSAAENTLLRSDMDCGPAKVRRKCTAGPKRISGFIILTSAQKATLEGFVDTTTLGGSLRFNWVDPDDGSTAVEMRFVDTPNYEPLDSGDNWKASMELEIMP